MDKLRIVFFVFLFLRVVSMSAQEDVYELDLKNTGKQIIGNNLDFYGVNPSGAELSVNSRYFLKENKPWFPLMGEFHFIRYPEQFWEEEIVKMKSAGLDIVATYIFWNAHENPQGVWTWEGIRDLRKFVELCQKHEMYVWLRIGPWSHGEQLNGGHPEWINKMRGKRSNWPGYLTEAQKLFNQIGQQVNGLFYKDGGPIIGVQLENEYAKGDINHIATLKTMALLARIDPVYFSITANTVFHDKKFEAIPLQGGYPYRGWEKGGGTATKDFLYGNDQWIMTDALGQIYYDFTKYPKGMCEQGCGSQMTYRNRFVVEPHVVEAHLQNQIGRGMNLIGYYMFQGGTQLPGLKEPGHPESYDFQAPLSEFGEIRPSYKYLKVIHNFIDDFGEELAPMSVVEPANPVRNELNTEQLRYVARANGNSGFLFLNNTQVRIPMPDKTFKMKLNLPDETIEFPREPITLEGERIATLPFNLNVNGTILKYATAQPICRINKNGEQFLFLAEVDGMEVELAFEKSTVQSVLAKGWQKESDSDLIFLTPKLGGEIEIFATNGEKSTIVLLTREEAENCWRTNINGQESVVITNADLLDWGDNLEFRQFDNSEFNFRIFPEPELKMNQEKYETFKNGVFTSYKLKLPSIKIKLNILQSAQKAEVELPEKLPENLSDIFIEIKYLGGSADAFFNEKKVTDNLFNAEVWRLGTNRYLGKNSQLTFKVNNWDSKITGVDKELVETIKNYGEQIEWVKIYPQYKLKIAFVKN